MEHRGHRKRSPALGYHYDDTTMLSTTISMRPELHETIRKKALEEGRSFSNMICTLAQRALRKENDNQQ